MASVGIALFILEDVSHLDGQIVVNGNVLRSGEALLRERWVKGDQLSLTPSQTQSIYKVVNLTRTTELFFQMVDRERGLLDRGEVTYLTKTQWRAALDVSDCAACDPDDPIAHDVHELGVTGHGMFVLPSSWMIGDEVTQLYNPGTRKYTLINHTRSDGITLP